MDLKNKMSLQWAEIKAGGNHRVWRKWSICKHTASKPKKPFPRGGKVNENCDMYVRLTKTPAPEKPWQFITRKVGTVLRCKTFRNSRHAYFENVSRAAFSTVLPRHQSEVSSICVCPAMLVPFNTFLLIRRAPSFTQLDTHSMAFFSATFARPDVITTTPLFPHAHKSFTSLTFEGA